MRISDWSSDVCSSDLGGRVSYAYGIHGGFTIANAVTIENAVGGSGNDTMTGHEASNVLSGGVGNDGLAGGAGNDRMVGGAGTESQSGGGSNDVFVLEQAGGSAVGTSREVLADCDQGSDCIDPTPRME